MRSKTDTAVDMIEKIRGRNNKLWMQLLRIALDADPLKAKAVVTKISENDKEITKWLSRI